MPNTIAYSFGDVVLVPFPFSDNTASKKRPAVVVSSDAYNKSRPDIIVMAVTSQVVRTERVPAEVSVAGWKEAGLLKPSLIKPVVATLDRNLVLRRLGSLQAVDAEALRAALRLMFG